MKNFEVTVTLSPENVKEIVKPYERRIKQLERDNAKLLKNAIAVANAKLKEELAHYRSEMQLVYGQFASRKELNAHAAFCKKHNKCRSGSKINSGKYPYVIEEGAGIGVLRKVICPVCGETKDITDIKSW